MKRPFAKYFSNLFDKDFIEDFILSYDNKVIFMFCTIIIGYNFFKELAVKRERRRQPLFKGGRERINNYLVRMSTSLRDIDTTRRDKGTISRI